MATTYLTSEGDMLDWICWRYYVQQSSLATAAFAADGLELEGEDILKSNTIITNNQHDGQLSQAVTTVWQANPSLIDQDLVLPAGLSIVLPDLEEKTIDNDIKLWD